MTIMNETPSVSEANKNAVKGNTIPTDIAYIKSLLKATPDFPKTGILFQDIFPIFRDPVATEMVLTNFVHHVFSAAYGKIDVVVGLDSRGFLLGPWMANRLGAAFVPVRKAGKLPPPVKRAAYLKEYGSDFFEISEAAIQPGQKVIVLDDLIATGGSAKAAGDLINQCGGKTVEYLFFVELSFLKGREKLDAPSYSLIQFDD